MNQRYTTIHIGNPYECVIKDHRTGRTYGMFNSTDDEPIKNLCWILNQYDQRLQDKDDLLRKELTIQENLLDRIAELEKELVTIKRTLDDMIDNERTRLGVSALMQYREAIQ